jgi:hypothetical protein
MSGKEKSLIIYDQAKDQIMVYVRAFYGNQRWDLSIHHVPLTLVKDSITDEEEYYSYVAYVFLEGLMFPKLKTNLKPYFLHSSAKSVLEKGNLTSKVARIISLLKNSRCDSREKIE